MFKRAIAYGILQPCPVGFHLTVFNFVDYHVQNGWKLVPSAYKVDVLGLSVPDCIPVAS